MSCLSLSGVIVAIIHTAVMHYYRKRSAQNTLDLLKVCWSTHFESCDQLMTYEAKEVHC